MNYLLVVQVFVRIPLTPSVQIDNYMSKPASYAERLRQNAANKNQDLIRQMVAIVGRGHVLEGDQATRRYSRGFRYGRGKVLAVVRPGTLVEQWLTLSACIAADKIVITQAANTGLTGGSTPDGDTYDRDVVIINTLRLNRVQTIDGGAQVICLPGATLDRLEKELKPLGREPHSVIGSSCIGASVIGGVCNNSGGALIHRGPAYTELALYAQRDETGTLRLINHLGVQLPQDPVAALEQLENGDYAIDATSDHSGRASDDGYAAHLRDINADTPARYNADPKRLFEASGCAGKLMVFAVRLDTFEKAQSTRTFYIGTGNAARLTKLRRDILGSFENLPVSAEYLHRDAYDMAEVYGKDSFLMIYHFGTARMPGFYTLKSRFDAFADQIGIFPKAFSDRVLQGLSHFFPRHLPSRMTQMRAQFDHHLILNMSGAGIEEARDYLGRQFDADQWFECTPDEARRAALHRFAAAGAAVRYRAVHDKAVEDIVALDVALRRNDPDWAEALPADLDSKISHKLYYGHFFCHVFHQDYIVRKGHDCAQIEHEMLHLLDSRGAKYPAEHNVGHLYKAEPALRAFYQKLDPCNSFNPGIGMTSKCRHWQ